MAHDVFISYSSKNKVIADAICARLEENNIRVWFAPRDVPPGKDYAFSIIQAIDFCKIFILIWSEEANKSSHILSEINHAFNKNITVIPFRIENVFPSESLEYYLGRTHWLDAITPPLEQHLSKLVDTVKAILAPESSETILVPKLQPVDPTSQTSKISLKHERETHKWPFPIWAILTLGLLLVAGLAIGSWYVSANLNRNDTPLMISSNQGATATESLEENLEPTNPPIVILTDTAEVNLEATNSQIAKLTDTAKEELNAEADSAALTPTAITQNPSGGNELGNWRPISFTIPSGRYWSLVEDQLTTKSIPWITSIAWSDEVFEGDLVFSVDVTSKQPPHGDAHFIIYGDGFGFTKGILIFHFGSRISWIEKDTIFHDGENWLVVEYGDFDFTKETYHFTIEATGDIANFYADGQIIATTSLPSESNRQGRIGVFHYCEEVCFDVTYSNPQINLPVSGD